MSNVKAQLRPLVWDKNGKFWIAYGAGICYTISGFDGVVTITINNLVKQAKGDARSSDTKTVTSYAEAMGFVQDTHYPHFMGEFIERKPNEVIDIVAWFKAAKPEPSVNDVMTQYGCHLEEVCEGLEATGDYDEARELEPLADFYKSGRFCDNKPSVHGGIKILDSLCDQIVTAIGVGYMMGFDMQGALAEVIRSNNSKMIDGKFEFDENGKIKKPKSFSEPQLEPFLGEKK